MEERMKVIIEADVSRLQKGIEQSKGIIQTLTQRANNLKKNLESATDIKSIAAYNRRLQDTQKELARLRTVGLQSTQPMERALNQATQAQNQFSRATSGSNSVALEFNRIIQDAPFGIMGVGNNIQQLAGNFSNLRTQAGSTGKALSLAFTSIISPVNLGLLAISAITAGWTAYSMWSRRAKTDTEAVKSEIERLKEASENYLKTLDAVNRSSISGGQNATKEVTALRLLYERTQDLTLSLEDRMKAVDRLQKEYPQIFGNLKDEAILAGNAKVAYDNLTNSIIARARAEASLSTLVENEKSLLALRSEQAKVLQEITKQEEAQRQAEERFRAQPLAPGGMGQNQAALSDIRRAGEEAEKQYVRYAEINKQINELTKDNASLAGEVQKQESGVTVELDKQLDKIKEAKDFKPIDPNQLFLTDYTQLQKDIEAGLNKISSDISKQNAGFQAIKIPVDFTPETLDPTRQAESDAFDQQWKERQKTIEQFGASMERTLAGAFERSIMNGDSFFDAVQEGFKRLLAKLAAQLAASAVIKILGTIIGGPAGGAIAGGAGGGALSGIFRANGGPVTKGQPYIVGEKRPELFIPNTSGRIIPHVPNVAPDMSASYGSPGAMEVVVTGKIMNDHIAIAGERGRRSTNRYYGINGK